MGFIIISCKLFPFINRLVYSPIIIIESTSKIDNQQKSWMLESLLITSVKEGLLLASCDQHFVISSISCGGQSGGITVILGLFLSMVTCLMIAIGVDNSLYGVFLAQIYQSTTA